MTVRKGRDAGGDFRNVEACRSARQLGCVIHFVTFNGPVPADSRFGRATDDGLEVLCTNPAALAGGPGELELVFPTTPFSPGPIGALIEIVAGSPLPRARTPWISVPGVARARCSSAGGANVLQVTTPAGGRAFRPVPDTGWGLHLIDVNLALGTLTRVVGRQARRWLEREERLP